MGGGETLFMEKILKGYPFQDSDIRDEWLGADGTINYHLGDSLKWDVFSNPDLEPKVHTFRSDSKDRWKEGNLIHPAINNRTPQRFQFAPTIKCTGVQKIQIDHAPGFVQVFIDGAWFGDAFHHGLDDIYNITNDLETLAINDGFDSVEQFFQWFDKDFSGKIIHWTDLRY